MIRFIRDAQPPNTQYKQGMVRDLGASLEASFIASGDAVATTAQNLAFPPPAELFAPGSSREDPRTGFTAGEVAATRALVSKAAIVADDTGTAWATCPKLLSLSAVLTAGGSTTVLVEVQDSVGTVTTAATIVCDTLTTQVLRTAFLTKDAVNYRIRRSSGTGSVTVTV